MNLKKTPHIQASKWSEYGAFMLVVIGNVELVGLPGEHFLNLSLRIQETEEWELVVPTCLPNGGEGYFPTNEAYGEGGYEAASTRFKAGMEDLLLDETKRMLNRLNESSEK